MDRTCVGLPRKDYDKVRQQICWVLAQLLVKYTPELLAMLTTKATPDKFSRILHHFTEYTAMHKAATAAAIENLTPLKAIVSDKPDVP